MPIFGGMSTRVWDWVKLGLTPASKPLPWATHYQTLQGYYYNSVYDELQTQLLRTGNSLAGVQELRNPAFRVVEFYAAKIWPGTLPAALPVLSDNSQLEPIISQLWKWSNFGSEKQPAARTFAMLGDLFLKAATRSSPDGTVDRVYIQRIDPVYVTDLESDGRGIVTYIRIDTPQSRRLPDGTTEDYTYTEIWTLQGVTVWEHTRGATAPANTLGTPVLSQSLGDYGIDFIPIAWAKFRDTGDSRGQSAFMPALVKIDEANRLATRLHSMLFRWNRPILAALAGGNDPQGRPLPPPQIGKAGLATLDDDSILQMPGTATLQSLVPQVDYTAMLAVLQSQLDEIAADLPELAYYQLRDRDLSGIAMETALGDALDRLLEARYNGESALIRVCQMCITLGQNLGLFSGVGTYELGELDFSFAPRPALARSDMDGLTLAEKAVAIGVPLPVALKRYAGWAQKDLDEMQTVKLAEQAQAATFSDSILSQAETTFDRGGFADSLFGSLGSVGAQGAGGLNE